VVSTELIDRTANFLPLGKKCSSREREGDSNSQESIVRNGVFLVQGKDSTPRQCEWYIDSKAVIEHDGLDGILLPQGRDSTFRQRELDGNFKESIDRGGVFLSLERHYICILISQAVALPSPIKRSGTGCTVIWRFIHRRRVP
jgi:hypothetical protein